MHKRGSNPDGRNKEDGYEMSSNNQLIILKNRQGQIEVHENLCVDNDFKSSKETLLKIKDKLNSAIRFANKYMQKEDVEYGYHIMESALK